MKANFQNNEKFEFNKFIDAIKIFEKSLLIRKPFSAKSYSNQISSIYRFVE
jgi:hypothetical protein